MKLEIFTTRTRPSKAINEANERISKMESAGWKVVNLIQSKSSSYDHLEEKEKYTFNLTVSFSKDKVQ